MQKKLLGESGMAVSHVGLGTAQLSNTDNKFKGVKHVSVDEARKILSTAFDGGINYFDTGAHYGNTETLLGELKRKHGEQIIIATKVGLGNDGVRNFSMPFLRNQIENSLKRIDVDCLDILQLNKPTPADLSDGQLFDFLGELKKEGKIRCAGVVVGDTSTGYQCLESEEVDSLQILYNLLCQETEDLIQKASEGGLGVVIRSPLGNGLLSGGYTGHQTFNVDDERATYFSGPDFAQRLEVLHKIQSDLVVSNEELIKFSIRFILSNPYVSTVIPGASKLSQVEHYFKITENFSPLGLDELLKIKNTVSRNMKGLSLSFQNL